MKKINKIYTEKKSENILETKDVKLYNLKYVIVLSLTLWKAIKLDDLQLSLLNIYNK